MKLKLKIKHKRQKKLIALIEKNRYFNVHTLELFEFFKDNIRISKWSKIRKYFIVTSKNPGIILSLFSTIQELIPEIYFNSQDSKEIDELIKE